MLIPLGGRRPESGRRHGARTELLDEELVTQQKGCLWAMGLERGEGAGKRQGDWGAPTTWGFSQRASVQLVPSQFTPSRIQRDSLWFSWIRARSVDEVLSDHTRLGLVPLSSVG